MKVYGKNTKADSILRHSAYCSLRGQLNTAPKQMVKKLDKKNPRLLSNNLFPKRTAQVSRNKRCGKLCDAQCNMQEHILITSTAVCTRQRWKIGVAPRTALFAFDCLDHKFCSLVGLTENIISRKWTSVVQKSILLTTSINGKITSFRIKR